MSEYGFEGDCTRISPLFTLMEMREAAAERRLKRRTMALFIVTLIACGAVLYDAYQAIEIIHQEAQKDIACALLAQPGAPLPGGE